VSCEDSNDTYADPSEPPLRSCRASPDAGPSDEADFECGAGGSDSTVASGYAESCVNRDLAIRAYGDIGWDHQVLLSNRAQCAADMVHTAEGFYDVSCDPSSCPQASNADCSPYVLGSVHDEVDVIWFDETETWSDDGEAYCTTVHCVGAAWILMGCTQC